MIRNNGVEKATRFRYNPKTGGVTFKAGGQVHQVTVEKGLTSLAKVKDAVMGAYLAYHFRENLGLSFSEAGKIRGESVKIQPGKGDGTFGVSQ